MTKPLVDVATVMAGLKDFQRATVEHAFERLFLASDSTHRFLVADEVGLGKTMVARGVVAKAIEHLQERNVKRIDVIYICSNGEIASQNVRRLAVAGDDTTVLPSRLTLLPTQLKRLAKNPLNLIALTPATSFTHGSAMGVRAERVLLHALLDEIWGLPGTGAKNVMQGTVQDRQSFREELEAFDRREVSAKIRNAFASTLRKQDKQLKRTGQRTLRQRFDEISAEYQGKRVLARLPEEIRTERSRVIAELRASLAATCVEALEPDLIILDEFQRFKHLLTEDPSDAGRLARKLFEWRSASNDERARVLMLSATPYRMYTMRSDGQGDDHHKDFLATVSFLAGAENATLLETTLRAYKSELYSSNPAESHAIHALQRTIEQQLRGVMARTERLDASGDRNGMLVERRRICGPSVQDVKSYLTVQDVARETGQPDTIEYWKSAPYLLNFMEGYELRKQFDAALRKPKKHAKLASILDEGGPALLEPSSLEAFEDVDSGSARLRELKADVIDSGAWQLLWIPPSMPYYELGGAYAEPAVTRLTKRLVFSAWRAVPRAVASLLSYYAEREITLRADKDARNTSEERQRRGNRLAFSKQRVVGQDDRLTGMPVLALLNPSPSLARLADPLEFARLNPTGDVSDVRTWATDRAAHALQSLPHGPGEGPADQRWYWAAPLLLDKTAGHGEWWDDANLAQVWSGDDTDDDPSLWQEHVALARATVAEGLELGRRPEDLSEVIGLMALAAPAACALRALARSTNADLAAETVRDAAARVAWALRSTFNTPEASMLISTEHDEVRWRAVLLHSADGCLQSVLDEYSHVLLESEGLQTKPDVEAADGISDAMVDAMTLRASRTTSASYETTDGHIRVTPRRLHTAFAARFGDDEGGAREAGEKPTRPAQLRAAFNSPFWPFVLVSTSVGQEGLDFHPYCHAVVHWNLPTNPIDLEQREGRVHRYKNHAVRRNVGDAFAAAAVQAEGDPWSHGFALAARDRDPTAGDLVPFWVYPQDGGAHIERHVLALPLSRELDRLETLRSALAIYRLAFGQARQDDVVAHLVHHLGQVGAEALAKELRINLQPG